MSKGSGTTLTLEEVNERIRKKHGVNIKMFGYTIVSKRANFTCLVCGHMWKTRPDHVYTHTGCPKCSNRVKYTREEIISKIESKGGKLLTKGKVNTYEKMKIKYSCGHVKNVLLNDFLRHLCACGVAKKRGKLKSEKMDKVIIDSFSKIPFDLISIKRKLRSLKVEFRCDKGHVVNQLYGNFSKTFHCKTCTRSNNAKLSARKRKLSWRGKSELKKIIRANYLDEWKKESMEKCDYKCVITGSKFDEIHHLYPLSKIITHVLEDLKIEKNKKLKDISKKMQFKIIDEIVKRHYDYPLGAYLRKDIHYLFHKKYGKKNFTPENFYEFKKDMRKEV